MRRALIIFLALITSLILLGIVSKTARLTMLDFAAYPVKSYMKKYYFDKSPETSIREYMNEIQADAALLAGMPFFQIRQNLSSDASEKLNNIVGWEGHEVGDLKLDTEIVEMVRGGTEKLAQSKINWQQYGLNFDWIKDLNQFDHWNYDQSGPVYEPGKSYRLLELPIPEYNLISNWAQLRMKYAYDQGQIAEAFKEVRHLATLIFSNHNHVSAMVAIAILSRERSWYDLLSENQRHNILKELGHEPLTKDEISRARRFYFALPIFSDLRLADELFSSLSSFSVGVCIYVNEGIYHNLGWRRILQNEMPKQYSRFEQFIVETQSSCPNSYLRTLWNDTSAQHIFDPEEDIFTSKGLQVEASRNSEGVMGYMTIGDLEKHPRLAATIVYFMAGAATPNYMRAYEQGM